MDNKFVEKLKGFASLTRDAVQALKEATRQPQVYGPRKDLIREGDRPGPVFVVLEGWAMRYKVLPSGSRQIMAFLMPGDACDLNVGMLAQMDHSMQTVTRAQVATIESGVMDAMMAAHPSIARAMYVSQLVDEGTLRAWIVSLGRRSSAERAAHLLLELYVRGRRSGEASGEEGSNVLGLARYRNGDDPPSALVELVRQPRTAPAAIEAARAVLEAAGLTVVVCSDGAGRIVDRLVRPKYNAALRFLDEGLASAADMDLTCRLGLGYPDGPIERVVRGGLAAHHVRTRALFAVYGPPAYAPARRAGVAALRRGRGA